MGRPAARSPIARLTGALRLGAIAGGLGIATGTREASTVAGPALGRERPARPARARRSREDPTRTPRLRARLAELLGGRRARMLLILAPVCALLAGGGWLWLRHSSFVAVQNVKISGVRGPESAAIEAALSQSARGMSTLAVSDAKLRAAVAQFPVVREVRAIAHFPHSLRVLVTEQLPVAALSAAGVRTAVAADGVVLGPALLSSSLPTLTVPAEPVTGQRVSEPQLRSALSVLGAAPGPLARLVKGVSEGPRGLTVTMANGLQVLFGDGSRPHAKWLSLVRVLEDPGSTGAYYVDVRVPERPAAGFPGGVDPNKTGEAGTSTEAQAPAGSESAVGALAAGLAAGSGVGASGTGSTSTSGGQAQSAGASAETSSGQGAEASGEGSSSATSTGGGEATPAGG